MRFLPALFILSISCLAALAKPKEDGIPLTCSFSGAEMYKTWCASCHGVQGKGDGPAAAALGEDYVTYRVVTLTNYVASIQAKEKLIPPCRAVRALTACDARPA